MKGLNIFGVWFLFVLLLAPASRANSEAGCTLTFSEVEGRNFNINGGKKLIVTYALSEFNDNNDSCWKEIKKKGTELLEDIDFGAIYFFELVPDEVPPIENEFEDFNPYGKELVAKYWKGPGGEGVLIRYPGMVR